MSSSRSNVFQPGRKYKAKKNFKTSTDYFLENEIVAFVDSNWGRYEECTAFRFISVDSGESKSWFLYDQDVDDSSDYFEPIS